MNLITLNTWGGRAGREKLLPFFNAHKDKIDVFCLQEIWAAPYEHLEGALAGGRSIEHDQIITEGMQEISVLLSGYTPYFHPHFLDNYGLMTLVKRGVSITEEGEVFVYKHKGYVPDGDVGGHARNIQYVTIETGKGPVRLLIFMGPGMEMERRIRKIE